MRHGGARPGAGRKPAPGESFEAARRRKESALAPLREQELARRRELLVDKRVVEREIFALVSAERESWLYFPSDVAGEVAAALGADVARVEIVLERVVRQALTRMTAARLRSGRAPDAA